MKRHRSLRLAAAVLRETPGLVAEAIGRLIPDVRPIVFDRDPVTMPLYEVFAKYQPGSHEWGWADEFNDIAARDRDLVSALRHSIGRDGMRESVLLGDDQRVWDGHHRLLVARQLSLESVPVTFGYSTPGWSHGKREAALLEVPN